jgi:hypothetical protein
MKFSRNLGQRHPALNDGLSPHESGLRFGMSIYHAVRNGHRLDRYAAREESREMASEDDRGIATGSTDHVAGASGICPFHEYIQPATNQAAVIGFR